MRYIKQLKRKICTTLIHYQRKSLVSRITWLSEKEVTTITQDKHLITDLQHAQLMAYRQTPHGPVAIYQDNEYLWLSQDQQVQSVMAKQQPSALLFSYQQKIVEQLPKTFSSLLELGLGGGSFLRYLLAASPSLEYRCIEHNPALIDWFAEYFNPLQQTANILLQDAMTALAQQPVCDVLLADLYDDNGSPAFLFDADFYLACKAVVQKQLIINLLPRDEQQLNQAIGLMQDTFQQPATVTPFAGMKNRLLILNIRKNP